MKALRKTMSAVHHYCACFLQCPGGAFTPNVRTTKEFPDDVVTFIRNHPLMFNPIYPIHKRPLIIRIGADYKYTKIAVDRVNAADGRYHVLFLGTGKTNLAAFIFLCCNVICNQLRFLQLTAFRNICLKFAIYRNGIEVHELCSLCFLCIFLFTTDISYVQEIQCIDLNFETKKQHHCIFYLI